MRRQDRLAAFFPIVRRRLCQLDGLVSDSSKLTDTAWDKQAAYACIEALNGWISFIRFYYVSSACGARLPNGARITSAKGRLDATGALLEAARFKKKDPAFSGKVSWIDEPTWYDPNKMDALFKSVGLSNQTVLTAAFNYPTNVFDGLPKFRNFYAHRNRTTLHSIKPLALGLPLMSHPSRIIKAPLPTRHRPVIRDWLSDLVNVADLLCN